MKILVIGASKGTGALAAKAALERGHSVTAFARSPQNLALEHERLTRTKGDFHDAASIDAAVRGQDAVFVTAMPGSLKAFKADPRFFSQGTALVLSAMKAHGVRRLVILSALGVGDSGVLFNFVLRKMIVDWILKLPYEDHDRQEQLVRESGLEWVIARPSGLTDGPARRRYTKTAALEKVPLRISRADVADFMVEACEGDAWVHKAVHLGG